MQTLQQALPYKEWIVGVGLDSDEKDNPPVKFAEVFSRARVAGFKLTMHCDVNQENTLDSHSPVPRHHRRRSHRSRRELAGGSGAVRDHSRARPRPDGVPGLEPLRRAGLTAGEIQRMLQLGMRATINSDDPAYFRAYVNENLIALQTKAAEQRGARAAGEEQLRRGVDRR